MSGMGFRVSGLWFKTFFHLKGLGGLMPQSHIGGA